MAHLSIYLVQSRRRLDGDTSTLSMDTLDTVIAESADQAHDVTAEAHEWRRDIRHLLTITSERVA